MGLGHAEYATTVRAHPRVGTRGVREHIRGLHRRNPITRRAISDFLFEQPAHPRVLELSGSRTRKRSKEIVSPRIMLKSINDVLADADLNYGEKEFPQEQPYIERRLIPYMKEHKLPYPVIEVYRNDWVDNARPGRPHTDIHIVDGAHRIVAMKKLGFKRIPFVVYYERLLPR